MAICLFTYLGVETAAVAAAKVRDPERNVPRATSWGTLATAVVYMLSLVAVFGIVPATSSPGLQRRPFSTRSTRSSAAPGPATSWPRSSSSPGFGALNGWTMICAEMPLAAAKDGLFPRAVRAAVHRRVPAFGIVASTGWPRRDVVNYLGSSGATVFTTLVLMTGITAAIPYAFSALAQIKWRTADQRTAHPAVRA